MFARSGTDGYRRALDGIEQKTLVYGDSTLMVEFRLQKGACLPLHSHPHEQSGYLVKGRMHLTIGADTHEVLPGDSWCIPGGISHGAGISEDSVAVEVFSPGSKGISASGRKSLIAQPMMATALKQFLPAEHPGQQQRQMPRCHPPVKIKTVRPFTTLIHQAGNDDADIGQLRLGAGVGAA